MGKISKIIGVLFAIGSFAMLALSLFTEAPSTDAGVSQSFALWVYSVIFAIIAMILFTIGALTTMRSGASVGKLIFTIAVLALCLTVGGALDTVAIIVWNVIFAINLILQIAWIAES